MKPRCGVTHYGVRPRCGVTHYGVKPRCGVTNYGVKPRCGVILHCDVTHYGVILRFLPQLGPNDGGGGGGGYNLQPQQSFGLQVSRIPLVRKVKPRS